jgi:hypothetical protein
MKYLKLQIVLFMVVVFAQNTFANVPQSWIKENDQSNINLFGLTSSSNNEEELGDDFEKIFNTGYTAIDPDKKQQADLDFKKSKKESVKGPWYLQSMKTEIGIESSGAIGFIGIGGAAAAEFIWQRTKASIKKLQLENLEKNKKINKEQTESQEESQDTLLLTTDMTQDQVVDKVDSLMSYVEQTKKVKNTTKLRAQLLSQISNHQKWVNEFVNLPEDMPWVPYKYQLELYAQIGGEVSPFIEVGGVIRIRIEWDIKHKILNSNKTQVSNVVSSLFGVGVHLKPLILNTASDNLYQLSALKLGLGIGLEGDIDVIEVKGKVIASVFLRPDKNKLIRSNYSLLNFNEAKPISGIDHEKWKKGAQKIFAISEAITEKASISEAKRDRERPFRNFELGAIEVELTLTTGGEFLLPMINGIAFMELFYTKK